MKALLIKSKNGKDASVIACGKVSELSKKIRNLTEFPIDSDLVQLWERSGGVRKSVTISQFKSRAARSETPEIVSPDDEEAKIEGAKKIKSEKAKAKRAEKAQAKKELSEVQAEAIKALSE